MRIEMKRIPRVESEITVLTRKRKTTSEVVLILCLRTILYRGMFVRDKSIRREIGLKLFVFWKIQTGKNNFHLFSLTFS